MPTQTVDPRHDLVHEPDPGRERWRESYYFQFYDFEQGVGSYSSIGYRPVKGYSGSAHVVWGPELPTLAASEMGKRTEHNDEHDVAGLRYEPKGEPFGEWRLAFDGRLNDGGTAIDCDLDAIVPVEKSDRPSVEVHYDVLFVPDQPAYMYREDPQWDGLFDGHIDEVGTVKGSLTIGDRTYPIDGRGSKDHSWGVRDWSKPKGWRFADLCFEEGPEATIWRTTFDGETWIQDGAIYVDGRAEALVSFEEEMTWADRDPAPRPATWEFVMRSESQELRGRAEILRCVPLRFPFRNAQGEKATMWNDRTSYRVRMEDGREGVGSAEFQIVT